VGGNAKEQRGRRRVDVARERREVGRTMLKEEEELSEEAEWLSEAGVRDEVRRYTRGKMRKAMRVSAMDEGMAEKRNEVDAVANTRLARAVLKRQQSDQQERERSSGERERSGGTEGDGETAFESAEVVGTLEIETTYLPFKQGPYTYIGPQVGPLGMVKPGSFGRNAGWKPMERWTLLRKRAEAFQALSLLALLVLLLVQRYKS